VNPDRHRRPGWKERLIVTCGERRCRRDVAVVYDLYGQLLAQEISRDAVPGQGIRPVHTYPTPLEQWLTAEPMRLKCPQHGWRTVDPEAVRVAVTQVTTQTKRLAAQRL
jgi:hypothetical protein